MCGVGGGSWPPGLRIQLDRRARSVGGWGGIPVPRSQVEGGVLGLGSGMCEWVGVYIMYASICGLTTLRVIQSMYRVRASMGGGGWKEITYKYCVIRGLSAFGN